MNHWKPIIILIASVLCLCSLVVVLAIVDSNGKDILARIEKDINRQGHCMIPGTAGVEIQARSARMEDGCLTLSGSRDPNEGRPVRVAVWPHTGSEGTCSAWSVSIRYLSDPEERLELTFYQPTHLPRFMVGRSCYVSLPKRSWIRWLRYDLKPRIMRPSR